MKHLFRILLAATTIAAMAWACKKTEPEKPKSTFVLEATVTGEANFDGTGEISYTVKSIKKIGEKEEFIPWTMEFSTDGGQSWNSKKPDFITLTTQENNGGTTAKTYTATFSAQTKTGSSSNEILSSRDVKNDVDLSMVDIHGAALANGQSTANCYVIHNPGTYKFPTIYGNARKNGQDNQSAYKSSKSSSNILKTFLGANGEITKPEIENVANACLIWQDTKDLISNISYDSGTKYVKFDVNKSTIHNGNAIIAVRNNSNTILWSWHIWVTEEDLTTVEITNYQGVKYDLMPVNLGWCGLGNAKSYAQREVKVKIKQKDSDKNIELALTQTGYFEGDRKSGNCTFYQWGRKDPILPSDGTEADKEKECFTKEDRYKFDENGLNTTDIKEYIKNPHKFNVHNREVYLNLWNVNNDRTDINDDVVVKTVYDPSPVGYTVPAPNAFTGFTSTGQNVGTHGAPATHEQVNAKIPFDKGWDFYTKPNKQGHTIFFPAIGMRSSGSGALEAVSIGGGYQTAGPGSTEDCRGLGFTPSNVFPQGNSNRNFDYAVRCAKEK